jgi:hypothetical protein
VGFARSITGSHYLLGFGVLRSFAVGLFPSASFQDELAVAQAISPMGRALLILPHVIAAAVLIYLLVGAIRNVGFLRRSAGLLAVSLVIVNLFGSIHPQSLKRAAPAAVSLVDSLLAAEAGSVYLASAPLLASGPEAARYGMLLEAISGEFDLVEGPAVRQGISLRRIVGRK